MFGPSQLDLAKTLADENRGSDSFEEPSSHTAVADAVRHWAGRHLISFGERLTPRTNDLQLNVSTGPPCP